MDREQLAIGRRWTEPPWHGQQRSARSGVVGESPRQHSTQLTPSYPIDLPKSLSSSSTKHSAKGPDFLNKSYTKRFFRQKEKEKTVVVLN